MKINFFKGIKKNLSPFKTTKISKEQTNERLRKNIIKVLYNGIPQSLIKMYNSKYTFAYEEIQEGPFGDEFALIYILIHKITHFTTDNEKEYETEEDIKIKLLDGYFDLFSNNEYEILFRLAKLPKENRKEYLEKNLSSFLSNQDYIMELISSNNKHYIKK